MLCIHPSRCRLWCCALTTAVDQNWWACLCFQKRLVRKQARRRDNRWIPRGKSWPKSRNRAGTISKHLQHWKPKEVNTFLLTSISTKKRKPSLVLGQHHFWPRLSWLWHLDWPSHHVHIASTDLWTVCCRRHLIMKFYLMSWFSKTSDTDLYIPLFKKKQFMQVYICKTLAD